MIFVLWTEYIVYCLPFVRPVSLNRIKEMRKVVNNIESTQNVGSKVIVRQSFCKVVAMAEHFSFYVAVWES